MNDSLNEYKDLYILTSREYLQELNKALLKIETNSKEKSAIEDIFRSAHSLKSQSAAMGYNSTAYLCHTIEDVFYEIKENRLTLKPAIADILFLAFDNLTTSIDQIEKVNKEIDCNPLAEKLKATTGVQTEGVGKSVHVNTPSPAAPSDATPNENQAKSTKTLPVKVVILDDLMNLVEELLEKQLFVKELSTKTSNSELKNYYLSSQKILENLQYKVMQARAISVGIVFEHFPRTIRDLSHKENKIIELKIIGQELELDRTIVDRLDEPLIHILRNSVSHGIEKEGIITIEAKREKDYAVISVHDNGRGIDWTKLASKAGIDTTNLTPAKKNELLFSGISSSDQVTELSGRGVGMKVVKKMIEDFGGNIDIQSETGKGTKVSLRLPLTLAIVKAIMVKVEDQNFAIPSLLVDRIMILESSSISKSADRYAFVLEETEIPLINLKNKLNNINQETINTKSDKSKYTVVVIWVNSERIGLIVNTVFQTEDIVVKELPKSIKNLRYYSGTTIISNGQPALVINPQGLAD